MGDYYKNGRHGSLATGVYSDMTGRRALAVFADGHAELLVFPWDPNALMKLP
jgi:prepilin-type processing-associated H-X9-DG protein